MSRYIADHFGETIDFLALIENPDGFVPIGPPGQDRPFARIASPVPPTPRRPLRPRGAPNGSRTPGTVPLSSFEMMTYTLSTCLSDDPLLQERRDGPSDVEIGRRRILVIGSQSDTSLPT